MRACNIIYIKQSRGSQQLWAMVRDLGIFIDADLSMRSHVQWSVAGCFAVLRQLRSIRRSVPSSVYQTLVVALMLTKLDYGNATLAGLPANLLNRLQSVINAAARSIAGLRRSERITDTLASFHWLRVPERSKFKLAVIVYRPSSQWHCTSVPSWAAQLCCWHAVAKSSSVIILYTDLVVRPSRLVTAGDRSFAAAGPRLWNSLPEWRYNCCISAGVSTKTENALVSAVISGYYFVGLVC